MSLLFLTKDDMRVVVSPKGKTLLCHQIRGYSMILFHSSRCEYCKELIPIFKRLPMRMEGCHFGMFNVDVDRETMALCKKMTDHVPYIVLYSDGEPYMSYNGPPDEVTICQFIVEVAQAKQSKQKFASQQKAQVIEQPPGKQIPAYCLGNPLCGKDNVCYLEFDTAYVAMRKQPPNH